MSKEKYIDDSQEKKSINSAFFDGPRPEPFRLSRFIYNKREGTVLGRNTESWGKIYSIKLTDFFLLKCIKFHE